MEKGEQRKENGEWRKEKGEQQKLKLKQFTCHGSAAMVNSADCMFLRSSIMTGVRSWASSTKIWLNDLPADAIFEIIDKTLSFEEFFFSFI